MLIGVGMRNASRVGAMKNGANQPVWIRADGGLGHAATSAQEGVAETADTCATIEALAAGAH